jgi:hypothetical protein
MPKGATSLKDQEDTKLVPLEQVVLDKQVTISANLSAKEEEELIDTLAKTQRYLRLDNIQLARIQ